MRIIRIILWSFLVSQCLSLGCSTLSTHRSQEALSAQNDPFLEKFSSINIEYILRKDHYRFFVESKANKIIAANYLGHDVLEKGPIDKGLYLEFFKKTTKFIEDSSRNPVALAPCRNPYTVTLKAGEHTQTTHGCRSTDSGDFSKLVQEGEFLLYSEK